LKDNYGMALNQLQMVQLLLAQKRNKEAIELAKTAYENARKINAYSLMISAINSIKDLYKLDNDQKMKVVGRTV